MGIWLTVGRAVRAWFIDRAMPTRGYSVGRLVYLSVDKKHPLATINKLRNISMDSAPRIAIAIKNK